MKTFCAGVESCGSEYQSLNLGLKSRTPLVPSASPLSETIDNNPTDGSRRALSQLFFIRSSNKQIENEPLPRTSRQYLRGCQMLTAAYQGKPRGRAYENSDIASLNCTTSEGGLVTARQITEAGADALELNIYKIPTETQVNGTTVENGIYRCGSYRAGRDNKIALADKS